MTLPFLSIGVSAAILLAAWPVQGGQAPDGRLGQAKALYESAEYDTALGVLDGIKVDGNPAEARDRAVYRVLCLLALGHNDEAEAAAVQIIDLDPLFNPGNDLTPRLRAFLNDVRKRVLPAVVQTHYRAGKERYDRGDYVGALGEFNLVVGLFEAAHDGGGPVPAEDLETLALGFRDLARQKAAAGEPAREAAPSAPTFAQSAAHVPTRAEPVAIRQDVPPPPPYVATLLRQHGSTLTGSLEVVISARGTVDRVSMTESIHPAYDALLLAASKRWRYRPALMDGNPIAFVKRVIVNVRLP
jgi:tetratricopeptide (TPR) repeat protein